MERHTVLHRIVGFDSILSRIYSRYGLTKWNRREPLFVASMFCSALQLIAACDVNHKENPDANDTTNPVDRDAASLVPDSDIGENKKDSDVDNGEDAANDAALIGLDSGIDTTNTDSDAESEDKETGDDASDSVCDSSIPEGGYTKYPGPCTVTRYSIPEDTIRGVTRYTYDSRGALLEIRSDDCDDDEFGCDHIVFTVDENCRAITMEDYSDYSGRINTCEAYTYDDAGRIKTIDFDEWCQGGLTYRHIKTYDEEGNLVELQYAEDAQEEGTTIRTYTYDSHNNVLEETHYSLIDNPALTIKYAYEYDEQGNMIERETVSPLGIGEWRYTYAYDDAGNKIREEEDRDADGVPENSTTYEYDDYGNLLVEERTGEYVADNRIVYTYDCFPES